MIKLRQTFVFFAAVQLTELTLASLNYNVLFLKWLTENMILLFLPTHTFDARNQFLRHINF
jgi:hypothetical protein